jgi:hypothetical protein
MKKSYLVVLLISLFSIGSAFATCPTPYVGPYILGPTVYVDYTQDQGCYSTSGSVTATSISCFTEPSWSFGSGTSSVSTSFTLGSGDPVIDPTKWSAASFIDFSSPGSSVNDRFEIDVDVQHPNLTFSSYTVLFWSGLLGSISSCSNPATGYFTADTGDTIYVTVTAINSGSATIVISDPRIFNTN